MRSPDSKVSPGIDLVSVVVAGMVQVMADTGGQKDTEVTLAQDVHQPAGVDQDIPTENQDLLEDQQVKNTFLHHL